MTSPSKRDPFGHPGQAENYVKFRPAYPTALLEEITKDLPANRRQLLVDVACGSGQVLSGLAGSFSQAIGIDHSQAQLSCARPFPNVRYVLGDAYNIHLPDQCVDVLTIGQGMHWLDTDRFFKEVRRLVRPGGRFAVIGYETPTLQNHAAQQAFDSYCKILWDYWECDRSMLENMFEGVTFPLPSTRRVVIHKTSTVLLSDFVSYLNTWSPYRHWLRKSHDGTDCLENFHQQIKKALGSEENPKLDVCVTFFVIVNEGNGAVRDTLHVT